MHPMIILPRVTAKAADGKDKKLDSVYTSIGGTLSVVEEK